MIASGDRTVLVSSMGWVDRDALWVFDVARGEERQVPLASGTRGPSGLLKKYAVNAEPTGQALISTRACWLREGHDSSGPGRMELYRS